MVGEILYLSLWSSRHVRERSCDFQREPHCIRSFHVSRLCSSSSLWCAPNATYLKLIGVRNHDTIRLRLIAAHAVTTPCYHRRKTKRYSTKWLATSARKMRKAPRKAPRKLRRLLLTKSWRSLTTESMTVNGPMRCN